MNLIDAWRQARVGQIIRNELGARIKKKAIGEHSFIDVLVRETDGSPEYRMFDSHIFADWEIVKESKKIETSFRELQEYCNIPDDAKVIIEWELDNESNPIGF